MVTVNHNQRKFGLLQQPEQMVHLSPKATAADDQQAWLEAMEKFRKSIEKLHDEGLLQKPGNTEPRRVRVALIDDGIELSRLNMYNDKVKVTGLSYCYENYEADRPWNQSSTGHGTTMANMIVSINPWVQLCVLRLQERVHDGKREIFADSAARAIEDAVARDVDIISISWSIKHITRLNFSTAVAAGRWPTNTGTDNGGNQGTSNGEDNIKQLREAIKSAELKNILIFCSASDNIQASAYELLPYQAAAGHIFRIGAAGEHGQRASQTEDYDNIDFLFPGTHVREDRNPRDPGVDQFHDGSSVATALAAGLASLIIYCAILQHLKLEPASSAKTFDEVVQGLRERERMKTILSRIKSAGFDGKKFVPVWGVFGKAADGMGDNTPEEKWRVLNEMMSRLLSTF